MTFRALAIHDKIFTRHYIENHAVEVDNNKLLQELLLSMAVCHEVVKDQIKD